MTDDRNQTPVECSRWSQKTKIKSRTAGSLGAVINNAKQNGLSRRRDSKCTRQTCANMKKKYKRMKRIELFNNAEYSENRRRGVEGKRCPVAVSCRTTLEIKSNAIFLVVGL